MLKIGFKTRPVGKTTRPRLIALVLHQGHAHTAERKFQLIEGNLN